MEEEGLEILPNQNGGPQTMRRKTTPRLHRVKGPIQRIAMLGPFPLRKSIPEVMYLALILVLILALIHFRVLKGQIVFPANKVSYDFISISLGNWYRKYKLDIDFVICPVSAKCRWLCVSLIENQY